MSMDAELANFDHAARAVMKFLRNRYGFGPWLIVREQHDRSVVVQVDETSHGLRIGEAFRREDPVGAQQGRNEEPRIARCAADVRRLVDASMRERLEINACIFIPLHAASGRFIGTLCGFDNVEHPELDDSELPLLELLGRMLSGYIKTEIESADRERRNERFRFEAMTDGLTHLPNRRAWEEKLGTEESRSIRMGDSSFISIVELDAPGDARAGDGKPPADELLRKAALTLRYAVRNSDFVARIGDGEFAVLGIQCDSVEPDDVSDRIRSLLGQAGIDVSVGTAVARPSDSHAALWRRAVAAVRADHKAGRSQGCWPA